MEHHLDFLNPNELPEVEPTQIMVDEWYHDELVKAKRLMTEYFKIKNCPLIKTSDEIVRMYELELMIKKLA